MGGEGGGFSRHFEKTRGKCRNCVGGVLKICHIDFLRICNFPLKTSLASNAALEKVTQGKLINKMHKGAKGDKGQEDARGTRGPRGARGSEEKWPEAAGS